MYKDKDNYLIQALKSKIGIYAKQIIVHGYGLEKKGNNYKCINKLKHKHGDNNPSMSWDNEKNQFYCFTCNYILDIYNYYHEIQGKSFEEIMTENGLLDIDKPFNRNKDNKFIFTKFSQFQLNYIKSRKILLEILDKFNIANHDGRIAFIYKKDNKIIGAKLRQPMKVDKSRRFTAIKGSSDLNFWNQQDFENKDILYITEGEFDAIILYQCGFTNVVSIPNGAGQSEKVIHRECGYLNQYKSIIILSDNDDAGNEMDKIFIDNLGLKVKLIDKSLMDKRSDINQEYLLKGKQAIEKLIKSASIKIDGYRDITAEPYTGLVESGIKFIPTGIEGLDDCINELESKRITVITGRPGEGKTTFIEQIQNNAIDKGHAVLRVDGEHSQEHILNNSYRKLISYNKENYNLERFGRKYKIEPKEYILNALQKWHFKKIFLLTKSDANLKSTIELFEKIRYIVNIEKIELVILDNLMSLLNANSIEKYEQQSEFIQACHDLAINYNIHIILVVHPNKTQLKGQTDIDFYQISGTSDIANKADNIINISKETDEIKLQKNIDGHIEVLKNRGYGDLIKIDTTYDKNSSMLDEIINGNPLRKQINWARFLPKQYNISDSILNTKAGECPF